MQAITTYDIRGARQGGDVERLIEGMGLEQFAARVARIDAPAPAVVIDRAAARAALDAHERRSQRADELFLPRGR